MLKPITCYLVPTRSMYSQGIETCLITPLKDHTVHWMCHSTILNNLIISFITTEAGHSSLNQSKISR